MSAKNCVGILVKDRQEQDWVGQHPDLRAVNSTTVLAVGNILGHYEGVIEQKICWLFQGYGVGSMGWKKM